MVARLDIKGDRLIKHVQLEGVQQIGDPCVFASKYSAMGIDEIVLMDAVASLYNRNHLSPVIRKIARKVFFNL